MRAFCSILIAVALLSAALPAAAQVQAVPLDAHWNQGARDCKASPQPPLEVHPYDANTYILREGLCSTFEAPFMYLLIGKTRALLVDTGDVGDPALMPLAKTVMGLLPVSGTGRLPLLVVHTHRHLDHRAGDPQFQHLPNVQVVGYDLASVQKFYHFTDWPNGLAQIDLGDRTVDVLPTPGHQATHVAFYDRNTGLFLSGDFMMPGRLLIDDEAAERASADRAAAFVKDRPITAVLGGHIEFNAAGDTLPWESQYHPDEHVLPLSKADVLALPAAVRRFNGLYTRTGQFVMMDQIRMLYVVAAAFTLAFIALVVGLVILVRRLLRTRKRLRMSA